MKSKLQAVCLLIATIGSAHATVIFSDNFSSFSLGTTWSGGSDALNWNPSSAPNQNLASNGSQLNMQSNGGYGESFAINTTIPTPRSEFGDLTIMAQFAPLEGWLAPIEIDVVGDAGYARFFAYRWGAWASDGTGASQDISGGPWSLGTNYLATLNITNSGSSLTITNGELTVYSREYGFTRADAGDSIHLQLRQLTQGDETNTGASVDFISLAGVAIPEPSTSLLIAFASVGLLRRRRN